MGGITHLTAWVFEMGCCWLHLFLTCGGLCSAMDVMLMAEAYRLGVKRSSISLPWESTAYGAVFGKKPRVISAPRFVPLPFQQEEDSTLVQKEVHGKVTWSRITSVIPWPVTQERDLGRALENWRIIVTDNMEASLLGRQICSILDGTVTDMTVEQVIRDSLAQKAVSTLRSRASSLMSFARWKKSLDEDRKFFQ